MQILLKTNIRQTKRNYNCELVINGANSVDLIHGTHIEGQPAHYIIIQKSMFMVYGEILGFGFVDLLASIN